MSSLRYLNLSCNANLTNASLNIILRMLRILKRNLDTFTMFGCYNLFRGLVAACSILPFSSHLQMGKIAMRVLNLSNCGFSARLMGNFVQSILGIRPGTKRLQFVSLGAVNCGTVTINRPRTIKDLWQIHINGLDDAIEFLNDVNPTTGLTNTSSLHISNIYCRPRQFGNYLGQILSARSSHMLQSLVLHDCDMGMGNVRSLGAGLSRKIQDNGGLQKLCLSNCNFTTIMLNNLVEFIPSNDCVEVIDLRDNLLQSSYDAVTSILSSCRSLRSLWLTGTSANFNITTTTQQVEVMLQEIRQHPSLQDLGMLSGSCKPDVIKAICANLEHTTGLVHLDMTSIETVIHMDVLKDALRGLINLRRLFLYDGRVGNRLAFSIDHYSADSPSNETTSQQLATAIEPLQQLVRVGFSSGKQPSSEVEKILLRNASAKCSKADIPLHRLCTTLAKLGNIQDPNPLYNCILSKCDHYSNYK